MVQVATVVKERNGELVPVLYRLSGPYVNGVLNETKTAKAGEILPARPCRWEAWVLDNFPPFELFGHRFFLSDGERGAFYEVRALPFLEEGTLINLCDGWEGGRVIHGEYLIDVIVGGDNYIIYAERVGPVDETKFLHRIVRC